MSNCLFRLFVIILGVYILSGCESLHKNNQQVISSKTASLPLADKGTYHSPISFEDITRRLEKNGTLQYLTQREKEWLESVGIFPNHSKTTTFQTSIVGHCYKTIGGGLTYYISGEKIKGNYYIASLSDEGCFDLGAKATHHIAFVEIEDNQIGLVTFKNRVSLREQKSAFSKWLKSLPESQKSQLGIRGDQVSGVRAYKEYFNSHFKEILPRTKNKSMLPNSYQGELLQELLTKLKERKATKEKKSSSATTTGTTTSKAQKKTSVKRKKSPAQIAREKHLSKRIIDIDGFYFIGPKGINYISEKDNKLYTYIIEGDSKGSFKKNELTGRINWYSDSQQAYSIGLIKYKDLPHCTHWGNSEYNNYWSYSFKPVVETIKGKAIYAWKEHSGYNRNRVPKKICENAGIRRSSCEVVRCNKWKANNPVGYLASTKADAYAIYNWYFN